MIEDITDSDLTKMIREENDETALNELIFRHSGIYVDMLKKFGFKCLTQIQIQDIMSDKDYVIYKAALEYDPSKAKFSTHLANKAKYMCLTQKTKNKKNKASTSFEEIQFYHKDKSLTPDESCKTNDSFTRILNLINKHKDQRLKVIFHERYFCGIMKKLNFDGPINGLSLGNVSVNFLRELKKKDLDISVFPIGEKGEFEAYDKITDDFKEWISAIASNRLKNLRPETPCLKVWHINGSEKMLPHQHLYTFYEVDSPTEEELNIVKLQKHVFFSSSEASQIFKERGCDNVSHVPLGFDSDFYETDRKYLEEGVVHFGLIGKFERRKNTQAIIDLWANKFGNNPKYQLSCLVVNPFFNEEQMNEAINSSLKGAKISNINFLPRLKTNSEMNDFMNSIDIDLSGLSNGEGWNLPAFNCTALGKWSIVSNCSSHKDWATSENSILVDPVGKQPCYDNFFFKEGMPFNQGEYYKLNGDDILRGMKRAVEKVGQKNTEGIKLRDKFTYAKTVESILDTIYN